MIYTYEAKDGEGRTVTGSLDAQDERAAATLVRDQGYFPTRLVPLSGAGSSGVSGTSARAARPASYPIGKWLLVHLVYPIWSGVSLNELALCYRQFGAMLRAGVPIYQCLTTLVAQTRNGTFRRVLQTLSSRIQQGQSLSEGMGEYPWIFTDFHRSMVGAGELTGGLDIMFARLADALEQEMLMRRSIRRETFYPKAVIVCACLLPPLFLLFVAGGGLKAYLAAAVLPLLGLLGVAGAIFVINQLGAQWKLPYHAFLAMIPSIGGTVRMIALARFCRSLASLYAAGVAIPRAIQSAAETCGNAYMGSRIVRAIPRIMAGQGIVESMRDTNVFPPMVMSMLGTGEQTGSLDQTMDHVAEYYEQEAVVRLHQTSVTIGIIALFIAGIIVAIDVIGFYKGYGSQYQDLLKPDAD